MSEKVEGTVVLDGLIEGKLPDEPGAEEVLRQWLDFAASLKLKFNLEMDGNSFSILADDKPIPAEDLGPRPEERIADALGQLVKAVAAQQGRRVFSTLRSTEYLPGCEVQTIYGLGPDGTVQRSERTLQAETTPPPRRLTRREKGKALFTGESLGQVASQTLDSLAVIEQAVEMPVLRPLIGMDKKEIVAIAERIGTFILSQMEGDDCCQFLMPSRVVTHPRLERVLEAEEATEMDRLVEEALAQATKVEVAP